MIKATCEKCNSANLMILQTISAGPVQIVCMDCGYEKILNHELYEKLMAVYNEYICKTAVQKIQEEQGIVGEYV